MTDLYTDLSLGEYIADGTEATEVVEYDENSITAGMGLKLTGLNSDGQAKVKIGDATHKVYCVAIFAGDDGDFREVLIRGTVKVTFSADVTQGDPVVGAASGKFGAGATSITITAAGDLSGDSGAYSVTGSLACGIAKSDGAQNNDTGLIHFEGGGR